MVHRQPARQKTGGTNDKKSDKQPTSKPNSAKPPQSDPKNSQKAVKPNSVKSSQVSKPAAQNLNNSNISKDKSKVVSGTSSPGRSTGSPPKNKNSVENKVNSARNVPGTEKISNLSSKKAYKGGDTGSIKNDSSVSQLGDLNNQIAQNETHLRSSDYEENKFKVASPDSEMEKNERGLEREEFNQLKENPEEIRSQNAVKTGKNLNRMAELAQKLSQNPIPPRENQTPPTPSGTQNNRISPIPDSPDIRLSESDIQHEQHPRDITVETIFTELSALQKLLSTRMNRENEFRA